MASPRTVKPRRRVLASNPTRVPSSMSLVVVVVALGVAVEHEAGERHARQDQRGARRISLTFRPSRWVVRRNPGRERDRHPPGLDDRVELDLVRAALVRLDQRAGIAAIDEEALRLDPDRANIYQVNQQIGSAAAEFLRCGEVEQHVPERTLQVELGIVAPPAEHRPATGRSPRPPCGDRDRTARPPRIASRVRGASRAAVARR